MVVKKILKYPKVIEDVGILLACCEGETKVNE